MRNRDLQYATRADWFGLAKVVGLLDLGIAIALIALSIGGQL